MYEVTEFSEILHFILHIEMLHISQVYICKSSANSVKRIYLLSQINLKSNHFIFNWKTEMDILHYQSITFWIIFQFLIFIWINIMYQMFIKSHRNQNHNFNQKNNLNQNVRDSLVNQWRPWCYLWWLFDHLPKKI